MQYLLSLCRKSVKQRHNYVRGLRTPLVLYNVTARLHSTEIIILFVLGPDRNSGGICSCPVPVDIAGTARTVENRYSLKSESLEMLLFIRYNSRFF